MSPRPLPPSAVRFLLPVLALAACVAPDPAPVVRGPLPTRNNHPVSLTFLHMRPRRAVALPEGRWQATVQGTYTAIYEADSRPGQVVRFDGETAHAGVRLRRGMGEGVDLEVGLAATHASSGFLDSFVDAFHDFFNLPDQGREKVEDDQFAMFLRQDGNVLYELEEDRVGIADVPVVLTKSLREEDADGPAVAARFGIELPAGSESNGFGNGELDYGAGVLVERSFGRWTWTGALDVVVPGQPRRWEDADVDARELVSLQAGTEYRWTNDLSVLAQLFLTTPMTRDFTTEEFNREIADFAVGVAYGGGDGPRWFAAFQEDIVAATGPDFGVTLGATWSW